MESNRVKEKLKDYFNNNDIIIFSYLFGSYAKGTANNKSDIDIAIYININDLIETELFKTRLKFTLELEDILKREVDLIILNNAPPLLKHQVFKYGELLVCKDHNLYVEFKAKSYIEYFSYDMVMRKMFAIHKKKIKEKINND